jgi:hypothetical protein
LQQPLFKEKHMATITIRDLSENTDLDRQAMQTITGGSRLRPQAGAAGAPPLQQKRIVDFGTGVAGTITPGRPPAPAIIGK